MARRAEGAYSLYVTDAERSQRGWIGRENDRVIHSGALKRSLTTSCAELYVKRRCYQWQWRGVPLAVDADWRAAFAASKHGVDVEGACPICGARALHRYYQVGRPIERMSRGERFVAQGALWEWCSCCRAFEHYSALVPEWWHEELAVDESTLTALPDALDEAVRKRSR
jgi:hypothetical protein